MCCKIHFVLPIVLLLVGGAVRRSKEGVKIDRKDVSFGRVGTAVGAERLGLCKHHSVASRSLGRNTGLGGNPFGCHLSVRKMPAVCLTSPGDAIPGAAPLI